MCSCNAGYENINGRCEEAPSTICTSSCNSQLEDTQYQVCCDPKNYGNFVKVIKENAHVAYLVCPLEAPDWCNSSGNP